MFASIGSSGQYWSSTLGGHTNEVGADLETYSAFSLTWEDDYQDAISPVQPTFEDGDGLTIRCIAR